jgi:hypothetical protein
MKSKVINLEVSVFIRDDDDRQDVVENMIIEVTYDGRVLTSITDIRDIDTTLNNH